MHSKSCPWLVRPCIEFFQRTHLVRCLLSATQVFAHNVQRMEILTCGVYKSLASARNSQNRIRHGLDSSPWTLLCWFRWWPWVWCWSTHIPARSSRRRHAVSRSRPKRRRIRVVAMLRSSSNISKLVVWSLVQSTKNRSQFVTFPNIRAAPIRIHTTRIRTQSIRIHAIRTLWIPIRWMSTRWSLIRWIHTRIHTRMQTRMQTRFRCYHIHAQDCPSIRTPWIRIRL